MSFFFTKAKPEKPAPRGPLPLAAPRSARANIAALHRLGCNACPLNKEPVTTPRMLPTLAKDTQIYFMAEAPGFDEDENTGKPLTGPSGSLLRSCIPDGGLHTCAFDNVVNCRPPKNRTPLWNEIECCHPRRVKFIEQARPKLIVGLGVVPLNTMLGSSDMAGMRGRLFAVKVGNHECWFMPTYHPSFILRVAYDKHKPLNSKMGHCFRLDIRRAFDVVEGLKPVHVDTEAEIRSGVECYDGSQEWHFGRVCTLLDNARKADIKAIDIETKGLRPFRSGAAIMCAALSFGKTNFSFAISHPKAAWNLQQRGKLESLLKIILSSGARNIAQNVPFELEWFIWLFGKEVVDHAAWECTMMQAHFLDERRGKQGHGEDDRRAPYQNLNFLCKQHFGIKYKSLFKLNKKDMSKSDLGETLIYNAVDAKYTLRLYHTQTRLLKEQGLHDAYLEALPRQPTVALMQTIGIGVDQREVLRAQGQLEGEVKALEAEINNLKVVKAFKADHKEFNPLSGPDAITIFKEYLKQDIEASVDKGVLEHIDHPLAHLIVRLRNRTKLKSTYVDCLELGKGEMIYPDGRIHCNFNTTFAETGRTSSDAANMQNFPQRNDAWVRKQVVAPKNHTLVAFDYGQLEGCTAAMCSKDKVLVKALWEDYDMHMEWAVKIAHKMPEIIGGEGFLTDGKTMERFRSLVKNKMVFPAFFGAANTSICDYLTAATKFEISQAKIDNIMDEFWDTFAETKKWQDKYTHQYYETGFAESPTGRRHRYPLTRNQVVNFPVQSLACDIVCNAMNELSFKAVETSKWYLHPVLNVHDDLTFIIPDDDKVLEEAISVIYRTMLTPPYSCVNVPLSVKASIGPAWYGMQGIGKFWSHRDL